MCRYYAEHYNYDGIGDNAITEIAIAHTNIGASSSWGQLDNTVRRAFKQHVARLDPGGGLGLGNTVSLFLISISRCFVTRERLHRQLQTGRSRTQTRLGSSRSPPRGLRRRTYLHFARRPATRRCLSFRSAYPERCCPKTSVFAIRAQKTRPVWGPGYREDPPSDEACGIPRAVARKGSS